MKEEQYTYLKNMIFTIYELKKEYVEYKDMVNLKSVR